MPHCSLTNGEPIVFQIVYDGELGKTAVDQFLGQIGAVVSLVESRNIKSGDREPNRSNEEKTSESSSDMRNGIGALAKQRPAANRFAPFKQHRWLNLVDQPDLSVEDVVADGSADVGIYLASGQPNPEVRVVSRDDALSRTAANYVRERLELFNDQMMQELLRTANLPTDPALKVVDRPIAEEGATSGDGFSLASLIPLVLVLMTITGLSIRRSI
jgi:hypothetical protein